MIEIKITVNDACEAFDLFSRLANDATVPAQSAPAPTTRPAQQAPAARPAQQAPATRPAQSAPATRPAQPAPATRPAQGATGERVKRTNQEIRDAIIGYLASGGEARTLNEIARGISTAPVTVATHIKVLCGEGHVSAAGNGQYVLAQAVEEETEGEYPPGDDDGDYMP